MSSPILQVTREDLESLLEKSRSSLRKRAPLPLHPDEYAGPQALINPIQPGSYMAPHRHSTPEIWVPIRGKITLCLLDESGKPLERVMLDSQNTVYHLITGNIYHTAFATEPDSVFLNVNQGPFDPKVAKEFPAWAPSEKADPARVQEYFTRLQEMFR